MSHRRVDFDHLSVEPSSNHKACDELDRGAKDTKVFLIFDESSARPFDHLASLFAAILGVTWRGPAVVVPHRFLQSVCLSGWT